MSILYLDFIHEQTLVFYVILSDSTATFSSLLALKFPSRFIAIGGVEQARRVVSQPMFDNRRFSSKCRHLIGRDKRGHLIGRNNVSTWILDQSSSSS